MAAAEDIALAKKQEQDLVLAELDEAVAFSLGSAIRDRAVAEGLALMAEGIESLSLNPDTVVDTWLRLAKSKASA